MKLSKLYNCVLCGAFIHSFSAEGFSTRYEFCCCFSVLMEARKGASYTNIRIKGGPFRSKYRESSWIWRQNELIISKRKVRPTYWRKNPTNYGNKIRRYLCRKVPNFSSLFLPPSSRALSCLMVGARAAEYKRHLWAMWETNICLKERAKICLTRKNITSPDCCDQRAVRKY